MDDADRAKLAALEGGLVAQDVEQRLTAAERRLASLNLDLLAVQLVAALLGLILWRLARGGGGWWRRDDLDPEPDPSPTEEAHRGRA
jgi:hypothetical protein